jgi:hypothetical protein
MNTATEYTVRRFADGPAHITTVMSITADTEQIVFGFATDTAGRLLGAYYPGDLARQADWRVVTAMGQTHHVTNESHAVGGLISLA